MLASINKAWDWTGVKAIEIVQMNDFGNIIFKTIENEFWRICPEELYCIKIADSQSEYEKLLKNSSFIEDWEMANIVRIAKETVGELMDGEKYCLKLSGVLGGEYNCDNIGKNSHMEQIGFSGYLAKKIKHLPDGTKVILKVIKS
ncbi:MAG TPA: T6SS immunity protein Tdi1 domain-containing protein [Lentimicrobium sp.]|nr:T6SS immunity protein Tdi1 domain-containing protein [Lentimicrobium sp.]